MTAMTAPTRVASSPPDVVIRASAGTGKTFQLANRYLRELNDGVPAEEILATTFTRKAAGEILERILIRLAEAAVSEDACRQLAGFLGDRKLTPAKAAKLLERLTQQLHRVQVCTLDSFFSKVTSSFNLELGLPPGWKIIDDLADRQLRLQAIDAVLSHGTKHDVARLVHLLTKGDANRSITELVLGTVDDLYGVYQQTDAEAWERFPPGQLLPREELQLAIDALRTVPLPSHKKIVGAHVKAQAAAEEYDWEEFIACRLTVRVLSGETKYYSKDLPPELLATYHELIEHAKAVIIRQLAEQTKATHELLHRFDGVYSHLKHDAHAMLFDDVTRALAGAAVSRQMHRIAYRLDARVSHLLLDEFQDTSLLQWQVLRPLAERLVEAPHVPGEDRRRSFFCVGDVKQAIYGWRGGKAEIFEALTDELPGVQAESLNKSFRSSPPIIDTVNRIFTRLTNHYDLDDYADAVHRWCGRFETHSTAKTDLPGYVCLETGPPATESVKQADVTIAYAADRIAELATASPGCSVGVLVRRNRVVAQMIYELRRRGIAASEEGGNPLTDSAAVQLLLSVVRVADSPGHSAAAFHVAKSPLGHLVDLTDYRDAAMVDAFAERIRAELIRDGYGPVIERLARLLVPFCNARDLRRLQQLTRVAYGYQPSATLRPSEFARQVEHEKIADPTTDDVRVMTYHQAKGLEFDIVVLPELDADLVNKHVKYVTGQPGPTEPIDRVCLYRNAAIQSLLPADMQALFRESAAQQMTEALCLLYVAVTRAVHALHMIIAPSSASAKKLPKTNAGLLRAALTDANAVEPNRVLFETGDRDWSKRLPRDVTDQPVEVTPQEPVCVKLAPMTAGRSRGLDRLAPSKREGSSRIRLANVFQVENAAALDRGTLIHAWFEQVRWLDEDGFPDDATLRKVADELEAATHLDVDRILGEFHAMLQSPNIAWALTQKSYRSPRGLNFPADLQAELASAPLRFDVVNERKFAIRENETVVSGSIDRLVLIYRDDKLIAADIIDFKTDSIAPDDPAALNEKIDFYRGQLETYRPAVARMYRLPLERVSARLLLVGAGIVQSL